MTSMGDENPIFTLGDYSKPSHEGSKNTIELPEGNNAVPLRSDTIRWIMRRKLDPKGDPNRRVSNFTRRIKRMYVFVRNFTYIIDFMIVDDISSIIDPRMSYMVLRKPYVEISNMTHDSPKGVVRFTKGTDEIAYMMLHKIG
nr:MAK10-like protein [Tanacetum cinerariifolium]